MAILIPQGSDPVPTFNPFTGELLTDAILLVSADGQPIYQFGDHNTILEGGTSAQ